MQQLTVLMHDNIDWIARGLTETLNQQSERIAAEPAPPPGEAAANLDLANAVQSLTHLILEQNGQCTPVPQAPTLPADTAMARKADDIVDLGRHLGLAGLLGVAKAVRRRVLELVLWSDLEPEKQTCERRAAIAAYDQLELLLVQAWERDEQAHAINLGEAQVLQAMHYPVLIVDMAERIRWMNDAALTLWRAMPTVSAEEPRPVFLDKMISDLSLPWDSIVNQEQGWTSRASFQQIIETRTGSRRLSISAWPLPSASGATPTIALFLLDCTD